MSEGNDEKVTNLPKARRRIRSWAFLIPLLVLLLVALRGTAENYTSIIAWAAAYLVYILLLEAVRRRYDRLYHRPVFLWFRILAGLALITWLLAISQDAAIVLWPLYLIPVISCMTHFGDWRLMAITFVAVALGFWAGAFWLPAVPQLSGLQGLVALLVLGVLTAQLAWLVHRR